MLKIGITGGIGSGKSTVCKIFELLEVPVYYADVRAKELMTSDFELVNQIKDFFGDQSYDEQGNLNRGHLASIVFKDKTKLIHLNSLVHPAVARDSEAWQKENSAAPYTIKEAALLFESGSYKNLDKIITVFAPLEIRINRVMERDSVGREAVLARIKNQMPEEEKIAKADFLIDNSGEKSLIDQVISLHKEITALQSSSLLTNPLSSEEE